MYVHDLILYSAILSHDQTTASQTYDQSRETWVVNRVNNLALPPLPIVFMRARTIWLHLPVPYRP